MKSFLHTLLLVLSIIFIHSANAQYVFVTKWGTCGSDDGQFNSAYDVACDTSGYVYVSDRYNNRVQKFTSTGQFRLKWGTFGANNGEFNTPHGLTVDIEGRISVSDLGNSRIQKFNSMGGYITKFNTSGPVDVALDNPVNYFVPDFGMARITKFDAAGNPLFSWGTYGSGDGQFNSPHGIAVDAAGYVYVVDQNNNRVQKFNNNGAFVRKWGTLGSGNGQFEQPLGIAIDKDYNVYVADFNNNRIQKFDSAGNFITKWGTLGSGDSQFDGPTGVAVDTNGYVYVADYNNCRIQKFEYKLMTITTTPFSGTFCMGTGLNVSFIVSDQFNSSNTFYAQLSDGSGGFSNPINIGSLVGTGSGTISSAIPIGLLPGLGYRIRVIGTNPYVEGTDNGSNLNITPGPSPVFLAEDTLVCQGTSGSVYTTGNYISYSWSYTGTLGYDYMIDDGGGNNNNSTTITWLSPGSKIVQVEVTDANGCKGVVSSHVLVKDKPLFDFNSSSTFTCANQEVLYYTASEYPEYTWSFTGTPGIDYYINGGGGLTDNSSTVTWLTPGIKTAKLEITGYNGCTNSKIINVVVNAVPQPYFDYAVTNVCTGVSGNVYATSTSYTNYQWTFSGTNGIDYIIESGGGNTYSCTMTWLSSGNKTVRVNVSDSNGCYGHSELIVSVKQSPSPVFAQAKSNICLGDDWNVNTSATFTSYNWILPGVRNTDFEILSGGNPTDNFIYLKWLVPGQKTITLEVTSENGCKKKISTGVNVYRKPVPVIFGERQPCQFTEQLYTSESDVGTINNWSVQGGDILYQAEDSLIVKWMEAVNGMVKIVQTSLNGCSDSVFAAISVKAMPEVTLDRFADVCINDSLITLNGGKPSGGVYSGEGISNGIFNPKAAGVGTHEVTYTYLHNNGCVNKAKSNIIVNPQPSKPVIERIGNILSSSSQTGNQWFLNGSKIPGNTGRFLNIQQTGFYQVQVTDYNGCISDLSDVFNVTDLAVNDVINENILVFSPNPADEYIYFELDLVKPQNIQMKISNVMGETMNLRDYNLSYGFQKLRIDVKTLPDGLYILKLRTGEKFYFSKIIVRH